MVNSTIRDGRTRGAGDHMYILADQLTLSQPGMVDSAQQILLPPDFQTFRHSLTIIMKALPMDSSDQPKCCFTVLPKQNRTSQLKCQPKVHSGGGGGGSLEWPRGPKPSYFRKYFILLCTIMGGGKKEIKLH